MDTIDLVHWEKAMRRVLVALEHSTPKANYPETWQRHDLAKQTVTQLIEYLAVEIKVRKVREQADLKQVRGL